jgi:hypothetical protein
VGSEVIVGGTAVAVVAETYPVGADVAEADPAELLAITVTRIVYPTSAEVRR